MRISEVAKATGVSPPTIRYYEEIGLLPKPPRTDAGYRRYTDVTLEEVQFIRKAQAIGFTLDEIREIFQLARAGQTPCGHVLTLARQHLAAVDERIQQLQKFRTQLGADLQKWETQKVSANCGRLCQFITDADTGVSAETVRVRPARKGK